MSITGGVTVYPENTTLMTSEPVPKDTHMIEVRDESYGYTLAHRYNGRVLFVATYPNSQDAIRHAKKMYEHEQADGHKVVLVADPHLG